MKRSPESGATIFEISCTHLLDEFALAKAHRVRMLMAELGTFVHGCEISAITLTWQLSPLSGPVDKQRKVKFESLLEWNNTCATCGGKLLLPEGRIQHLALRVGMKDVRVGDYLTRSEISDNRADIYDCFSALTADITNEYQGWGDNISPISLYYANLYHPWCKNGIGKETTLE